MLRIMLTTLALSLGLSLVATAQQGSATCTTYGVQTQCTTPTGTVTCTTYGNSTFCQ